MYFFQFVSNISCCWLSVSVFPVLVFFDSFLTPVQTVIAVGFLPVFIRFSLYTLIIPETLIYSGIVPHSNLNFISPVSVQQLNSHLTQFKSSIFCLIQMASCLEMLLAWERFLVGKASCYEKFLAWKSLLLVKASCLEKLHAWKGFLLGKSSGLKKLPAWISFLLGLGKTSCLEKLHFWKNLLLV